MENYTNKCLFAGMTVRRKQSVVQLTSCVSRGVRTARLYFGGFLRKVADEARALCATVSEANR